MAMETELQTSVPANELQLFRWTKHGTIAVLVIALLPFAFMLLAPQLDKLDPHNARPRRVMSEMAGLKSAITLYELDYGAFPTSSAVSQAAKEHSYDFTYGLAVSQYSNSTNSNAELMAILMAWDRLPDGSPVIANANHNRNPRRIGYLVANSARDNRSRGLGPDGNYRDMWGNPYVVSLDLDYNGYCIDPVYSQPAVGPSPDQHFRRVEVRTKKLGMIELPYPVLIWSLGPDGKADPTIPADQGVNRDNILGWQ